MESPYYPDNDQPLEDKSILVNAIQFATGQRAFEAENILRLPLDTLDEQHRAYLAVQAFSVEMLGTEDLVGWHAVLRDWEPGSIEKSLLFLLHKVDVKPDLERELAESLADMPVDAYRAMIHVPATDQELLGAGLPMESLPLVPVAVAAQLSSARAILNQRMDSKRGRVVAYNKAKHVLVGLHRTDVSEVLVPARLRVESDGIHLDTVTLGVTPTNVREMAGRALSTMAVLNATLGLVAWARFGVPYDPPGWVSSAAQLPIWKK